MSSERARMSSDELTMSSDELRASCQLTFRDPWCMEGNEERATRARATTDVRVDTASGVGPWAAPAGATRSTVHGHTVEYR